MVRGVDPARRHAVAGARLRMRTLDFAIEVVSGVLMSLATVASAWSVYQATLWYGRQAIYLNAAGAARTQAESQWVRDLQYRTFDSQMLIAYIVEAKNGDTPVANLLYSRFRPEFKPALDAWLATDPLNNPDAPRSPFVMPQYASANAAEAQRLEDVAAQRAAAGVAANAQGDDYILLTVLFSAVLFFSGTAIRFQSRKVRIAMLSFGAIVLVMTCLVMASYPAFPGSV